MLDNIVCILVYLLVVSGIEDHNELHHILGIVVIDTFFVKPWQMVSSFQDVDGTQRI